MIAFAGLQSLGRALVLPIAALPVAGLMLRLGQPDLLNITVLAAAGSAIFDHLGLLFAIGIATGFARDGNGAACLAGVSCFLVATEAGKALLSVPPDAIRGMTGPAAELAAAAWRDKAIARLDAPIGIVSGLIGGLFYNRFSSIELPEYLAFFGGRRFVPIISSFAGLGIAVLLGVGFGSVSGAIDELSMGVTQTGAAGVFVFGVLNRLLLVTGLHHILNNVAWFVVGDYGGVTGDLRRFFAGDPSAGAFMTGFFPIMMFGLPAACLAMYHAAPPERRKAVGGMLLSLALTSALTGVTEPIEFTFMFLAPALYVIHAVLTGISLALTDLLGVRLGFSFSAGLFDYALNFSAGTKPLVLLPLGAAYFLLYYGVFRFYIHRFDLPTPGREPLDQLDQSLEIAGGRGAAFTHALGGIDNIRSVGACTTRLRVEVERQDAVDDAALKRLGAHATIRPAAHALQVVVGPVADVVVQEIRLYMGAGKDAAPANPHDRETGPPPVRAMRLSASLGAAVGGMDNIVECTQYPGRLRLVLHARDRIDEAHLTELGIRASTRLGSSLLHLLVDDDAMARLVEA